MNPSRRLGAGIALFAASFSALAAAASLSLVSPGGCSAATYTSSLLSYTYQVQNKTNTKISRNQLTLSIALDPSLAFSSYAGYNWSCALSGGTLNCSYTRSTLPKNKYTNPLTLNVLTPAAATNVTTTATAGSGGYSATLTCKTAVNVPTPSNFNASDASGNCAGKAINTKVVNTPFSLGIQVTNTASGYNPAGVAVYLVDAAAFGAPPYGNATNNCPSALQLDSNNRPRSSVASATVALSNKAGTFTSAGLGSAYQNLLVFMVDTASKSNYACSTDSFAVRPDHFKLTAQDQDWTTAGTSRTLNNTAANGGSVHAAGRPFTLTVQAQDAAGATVASYTAGGTAYFYDSTGGNALRPNLAASAVLHPAGGVAGNLDASFTGIPGAGSVLASDATYDEAGVITLQAYDDDFAFVDARNTCSAPADRRISGTADVGRFIPDALTVTALSTPQLRSFNADNTTCASRSFTYVGQPFGYATLPGFTVKAWDYDAANPGIVDNYRGNGRLASAGNLNQLVATYTSTPSSPALDASKVGTPLITDNAGSVLVSGNAGDTLAFTRDATPVAPFAPTINLAIPVMDCADQAGTGSNSCIPVCPDSGDTYGDSASSCSGAASYRVVFNAIAFDAGNAFRYGYLAQPATVSVPSPTSSLNIALEAKYYTAAGAWATNSLDNCTGLTATTFSLSNFTQGLAACETIASVGSKLTAGTATLTLSAPGSGNGGSVDVIPNLGATASGNACASGAASPAVAANLPWLQCSGGYLGNCSGGNPKTTATFVGTTPAANKTRHIYLREMF